MRHYGPRLPQDFDRQSAERAHKLLRQRCSVALWWVRTVFPASILSLVAGLALLALGYRVPSRFILWAAVAVIASTTIRLALLHWERQAGNLHDQLFTHAKQERERAHGLRSRNEHDRVTDESFWTPEQSRVAEWAYGETQERLPSDIVYEFSWVAAPLSGHGGLALERDGKIVAVYTMWV